MDEEIHTLREKLKEIDQEIDRLKESMNVMLRKKGIALQKLKETKESLKNLASERKSLISYYRELKESLQSLLVNRNELKKKLTAISKELRKDLRDGLSMEILDQRLKEMEWTIHVSILSPKEEKMLSMEIKRLERLKVLLKERDELVNSIRSFDERISNVKNDIENCREKINSVSKNLEILRRELDNVRCEIGKLYDDIKALEDELRRREAEKILVESKLLTILEMQRKMNIEEIRRKEEELRKKVAHEARIKLSQGKKLTFDEMKILLEEEDKEF